MCTQAARESEREARVVELARSEWSVPQIEDRREIDVDADSAQRVSCRAAGGERLVLTRVRRRRAKRGQGAERTHGAAFLICEHERAPRPRRGTRRGLHEYAADTDG